MKIKIATQVESKVVNITWIKSEVWAPLPTITFSAELKNVTANISLTYVSLWGGQHSGQWKRAIEWSLRGEIPEEVSFALHVQMGNMVAELQGIYPERTFGPAF